MNIATFLTLKNSANFARWAWRWHLQGGSRFWSARPLRDLRNDEDLRRYREIEFRRRRCPLARVVSLAAYRKTKRANVARMRIEKARHG